MDERFEDGESGMLFGRHQTRVNAPESFGIGTGTVGTLVDSQGNDFFKEPIHLGMESGIRDAEDFESVGIGGHPNLRIGSAPSASYAILPIIRVRVENSVRISVLRSKHDTRSRNAEPA